MVSQCLSVCLYLPTYLHSGIYSARSYTGRRQYPFSVRRGGGGGGGGVERSEKERKSENNVSNCFKRCMHVKTNKESECKRFFRANTVCVRSDLIISARIQSYNFVCRHHMGQFQCVNTLLCS